MSDVNHDYLSQKELATLLFENNILSSGKRDVGDLIASTEFNILRVLTFTSELSDAEIEEKYQAPHGLTYILSNLSADGLIVQTGSYKWRISDKLRAIVNQYIETKGKDIAGKEQSDIHLDSKEKRYNKKMIYKKIADILGKSSYIPENYTVIEDLYDIAELEILSILYEHGPLLSESLEELYSNTNPLSMTLSNLKADNLIDENSAFKWEINAKFHGEPTKDKPLQTNVQLASQITKSVYPANIVEQSQFIKKLLSINYFKNMSLRDIITTTEFQVLNLIYLKSPIMQEEIEESLPDIPSLAMILSNLKIDELIEQDNEYAWSLETNFRREMLKLKVERDEFLKELLILEKNYKKLAEKRDIPVSKPEEEAEVVSPFPHNDLQEMLIKYGYLKEKQRSLNELEKIPEYEIIRIITQSGSISAADLEKESKVSSISLTLSNLQADRLIEQTMDYKWELAISIKGRVAFEKKEIEPEPEVLEEAVEPVEENQEIQSVEPESTEVDKLLVTACRRKGYFSDEDKTSPELEILQMVKNAGSLSGDRIKELVLNVSPVHVTRTLSKLVAEDCLVVDTSMNYSYSPLFDDYIHQDELKEEKEREEKELARNEQEKQYRLAEIERIMKDLGNILDESDVIKTEERDFKKLMLIPEFELIALIGKDGPLSLDELKNKANTVAPVQVTHTISKLVSKDMIVNNNNILDLSPNLKKKLFTDFQ